MTRWTHAALIAIAAGAAPVAAQAPMHTMPMAADDADTAQLARTRVALAKYQDPLAAVRDGYFSTVACLDFPHGDHHEQGGSAHPGAMGLHFLNPALIGPQLDPLKPQVLIYEPVGATLKLIGAEWFVPVQVAAERPKLFGRDLDGPMEGHQPIMPEALHHWDLHVWLWKNNPDGMFAAINPAVHCPAGPYTARSAAPTMVHQ